MRSSRTLTYQASGMPAFVALARNTSTFTPIDAHRCRVSLRARFDTRGVLGLLGRWVILAQTRRTSRGGHRLYPAEAVTVLRVSAAR